jgi:hypothetical protein
MSCHVAAALAICVFAARKDSTGKAVRAGDYKLIEYYEDGRLELYDLANDLSEERDLVALQPGIAARLQNLLHDHRDHVGAQMPASNSDFKVAK